MFQFPNSLYTDVRLEEVFEANIQITLDNLENLQERTYQAAFIRVFDGDRWFYSATTDTDFVQAEIRYADQVIPIVMRLQQGTAVHLGEDEKWNFDVRTRNDVARRCRYRYAGNSGGRCHGIGLHEFSSADCHRNTVLFMTRVFHAFRSHRRTRDRRVPPRPQPQCLLLRRRHLPIP